MSLLVDGYEVVVGLEVHVQLLTNAKLFSPAPTSFGGEPNTHVDIVDAGLPGVLPVLNQRAVELAIRLGLALGSRVRMLPAHTRVSANALHPQCRRLKSPHVFGI